MATLTNVFVGAGALGIAITAIAVGGPFMRDEPMVGFAEPGKVSAPAQPHGMRPATTPRLNGDVGVRAEVMDEAPEQTLEDLARDPDPATREEAEAMLQLLSDEAAAQ